MASLRIRHARLTTRRRGDLADAIVDNIMLVAIRQRVYDICTGDINRDRIPKAIQDVSQEHGYDHKSVRIAFFFHVRGAQLVLPEVHATEPSRTALKLPHLITRTVPTNVPARHRIFCHAFSNSLG
eukprot:3479858-Amphidinium_carterae.1